ncbi:MAG: glutamate formimidoyltransferase [Bacteroidales bacterium]|nr:glutamate formimidoyltransferase [Bacteroidales bacterium]
MIRKIIECVPNFSEGRDIRVISQITDEIKKIEGVKLLNVDPGAATNRTVVTFVGEPEKVLEAAFFAIKKAGEIIDMRHHHGEHPRMGATDVCPIIPISNITLEECAMLGRALAKRVGEELGIPVYCYESSAYKPERRNLASCRSGEYEGLAKKFENSEWKPDFGPTQFNDCIARTGCSAIGARDFLVAINYNLNTTSVRRANAIAYDVREKGRKKREGDLITGSVIKDNEGREVWIPGTLKGCKAIGWYIEEYGIAQVSMNVTNISVTPVHIAFDEVCAKAQARGLRVTGSEIVGLIPKKVLIDAGKYYLNKQQRSLGITEEEIIKIAVKSMGLDDLKPFNPHEKVIEYLMEDGKKKCLIDMTCKGFAYETASESPAPGGGSISAYMGALGVSLGTMVANLSSHKPGWDSQWENFSCWAEKGQIIINNLLHFVDEDTNAFNKIMEAFGLPKENTEESGIRTAAIQEATLYATQVPLNTMKEAFSGFDIVEAMAKEGNPNSVSDAGVGALALWSAVQGAWLNVKINATGLKDKDIAGKFLDQASKIAADADLRRDSVLEIVNNIIKK